MPKKKPTRKARGASKKRQRSYLSQTDIPSLSLDQALRVPTAIAEHYAENSVSPLQLAFALMIQPTSGPFRQLCGASIAYGLTQGGYNAETIKLETLGQRIVRPLKEGDELAARREATLRPRVVREFLSKYNGSPLPRNDIALNVLAAECDVPSDRTEYVYELICESAESVGFLTTIKGRQYVDLDGADDLDQSHLSLDSPAEEDQEATNGENILGTRSQSKTAAQGPNASCERARRVYVTHGKNRDFVEPLKKLLSFGELLPVVSIEKQTVSKPLPDKVMDDMRSCSSGIIHVDDEMHVVDKEAQEQVVVNSNVLIEIGAAMALYGRRFILLVRDGVKLPSNLDGLYQVRYKNESLDGDTTIKLLEAINEMKKTPMPEASQT